MKDVLKFLDENINKEDILVVGCSGGPDSMCLLHILNTKFENKLVCVHINHNIREESTEELEFVKNYCEKNSIIFESCIFEKMQKVSEASLRKKRYKFYEEVLKKYNSKYLLTAHHGDDLIETVLMRLTRGSNLKGYAGIELKSIKDDYVLLRPLLYITKEDIEEYNKLNKIEYVIDESNNTDKYTRNRYRHYILPELKKENKDVHLKYLKFNKELLEYHNYINNIVMNELNINLKGNEYNLKEFYKYDKLIQRKIIEKLLSIMYPDDLNVINDKHVDIILDIVKNKSNGEIKLPSDKLIRKSYDSILINPNKEEATEYDYIFENELQINKYRFLKINDTKDNSNYCIKINSNDIKLPIHIRNRKLGDKIKVKNLNGTKKVKDILINEKISLSERLNIPIVVDDNDNVLWIPGVKKSIFDKSKEENYDIIIKCISENIQNTKENIYE